LGAAAFDRDRSTTLQTLLCGDMDMLKQADDGRGLLERMEMPTLQPEFMPRELIDYLAERYETHGFGPPLKWYRNYRRTFERLEGVHETIGVPTMFLTARGDWTWQFTQMAGIDDSALFSDLRLKDEIDGGHWLGKEHPGWVNARISEFFALLCY
jgi:pimeloyl-ACP methyl ester carboxylesterase